MNFEKKNNVYKIVMAIIVTAIITFISTTVFMYNYYLKTGKGITKVLTTSEPIGLDEKVKLIKLYIDKFYLGEINEEDMIESAIKGYVDGLGDEYTEYLTKDEYEELMVQVNGNYVGIGIYMAQDKNGDVVVLLPIEGSPAFEAELETGDIIVKVDGEEVNKMDLNLVANKIKGTEGTTVELEIRRNEDIINKTITRKIVKINNIKSEVLEGNIGYIQILSFDEQCSNQFEEKLNDLISKGIKSLIIDVRDNGGGIVKEATDIVDLFLEKDKNIIIEINKNGKEETIKAEKNPIIKSKIDIIILANDNTASASEIFIGALKENNMAQVVGIKTFGKGVMQELVPVTSGGALKITTKEFCMPNGDKINNEGIKPDIEIEDDKETETDEQLERALKELKK